MIALGVLSPDFDLPLISILHWQQSLEQKSATRRFGEVRVENRGEPHVVEIQVWLNDLDPSATQVEHDANGMNDPDDEEISTM